MTRIISIVSGKGGTGKTTITANLGAALHKLGKSVLVIDGNVSGANLATHLGIPEESQVSLNSVLKSGGFMTQAVLKHPSGFSIIPASIGDIEMDLGGLRHHLSDFIGNYNYILIDSAAGINKEVESAVDASDEVLIVTNPELPAIKNACAARELAEKKCKKTIGVVVNKAVGDDLEMRDSEIEQMIKAPVILKISESRRMRKMLKEKQAIVHHSPRTSAGRDMMKLAHLVAGEKMPPENFFEKFHRLWNTEITISVA